MTSNPSDPLAPELLDQLSAYLDGELDPDARQAIETLIANNDTVRSELQRLERAWDLLEELPRAEPPSDFTRTTVEMIALVEGATLEEAPERRPAGQVASWLGATTLLAIAATLGYLVVGAWWPHPNAALLEDLPVIERLDAYRQIDDIEFLRTLRRAGLFQGEEGTHAP